MTDRVRGIRGGSIGKPCRGGAMLEAPTFESPAYHITDNYSLRPKLEKIAPSTRIADGEHQIPVGLPGGRITWLIVPTAFCEEHNATLRAQVDLLFTEDVDPAVSVLKDEPPVRGPMQDIGSRKLAVPAIGR